MIHAPLIPLQLDNTHGYQEMKDLQQLVKFHLTNLLLTNPGERITLPNYGVGLQKFLFENASAGLLSSIKSRVRTQVASYLQYMDLASVDVTDNEDHSISLQLRYSVESINLDDVLLVEVDLNSGNVSTNALGVNY